jgi:beta-glucosidase
MKVKKIVFKINAYIVFLLILNNTLLFSKDLPNENEIEKRIDKLIQQMTLDEKVGQLNLVAGMSDENVEMLREGKVGSFLNIQGVIKANKLQNIAVKETRLGIPLIFGKDVIHGYKTIFPIPLGSACTWNPVLIQKACKIAAREASADGTNWTFAPMVDIARDARWGRIAEGVGEDPFLGKIFAKARVKGFQGNDLADPRTILACAKHYVAYGAAEAGKDYNTVDISIHTLREIYLPPFQAAVEAGVGTIMSAFNELSGIPATANHFILTQILRKEWNFKGFVVSDFNSIRELMDHGFAATLEEASKKAMNAGLDMDMMGYSFITNMQQLVGNGDVSEETINESVRRILRMKFQLGLFENPFTDEARKEKEILTEKNLKTALEVARESIVLLKNDNKLLPLNKNVKSFAIIGPLADNQREPLGCWHCAGDSKDVITVLEGIKNKIEGKKIHYIKGCDIQGGSSKSIPKAVEIAKKSDIAIVVIGESRNMSGEAASRASLDIPDIQKKLVKAVYLSDTPTIVILMNGRPLSIPWIAENIPAVLETWHLGTQCGNAIADVLFGDYNPSGKLTVTFPRVVGQVPIYYSHKNTGRPSNPDKKYTTKYIDVPVTPLYPFGYGLSYTKYEYKDLQISSDKVEVNDKITISANIKNSGEYYGEEIVQLYIQDEAGSRTRPVKELKGFQKIGLNPNESKKVVFTIKCSELGFYNKDMDYIIESGKFKVWIGPDSVEGLEGNFEIF